MAMSYYEDWIWYKLYNQRIERMIERLRKPKKVKFNWVKFMKKQKAKFIDPAEVKFLQLKNKLRKEIERKLKEVDKNLMESDDDYWDGWHDALRFVLSLLKREVE